VVAVSFLAIQLQGDGCIPVAKTIDSNFLIEISNIDKETWLSHYKYLACSRLLVQSM